MLAATSRRALAAHNMYIGQWTTLFLFSMPVVLLAIEAALAVYRNGGRQATAFRRVFSARCPSKVLDVAAEPLAMPLQEVAA